MSEIAVDPPAAVDLAPVTEATRRALYDAVVAVHFFPTREEIETAEEDGDWYQRHTPDECHLAIHRFAGRWFATWNILDAEEGAPEDQRYSLVRIEANPRHPFGLEFFEV